LIPGSRELPLHHVSIRTPWQDIPWTGTVCEDPKANAACLRLRDIHEKRDDEAEQKVAGRSWEDLKRPQMPACLRERASFMAPYEMTIQVPHPYKEFSPAHAHLGPTDLRMPPYSANCIPFRWLLRDNAGNLAEELDLDYRAELEEKADKKIGFPTGWVQDRHNQLVLTDSFFSAIRPQESLCFFYAKLTPLSDDHRRVLVGVGGITHVGNATEYKVLEPGDLRSMLWERALHHSIRPDFKEGFLFPYQQMYQKMLQDESFDPEPLMAFVPEEHFNQYSYTSEHLTHDVAIASLLICQQAIEHIGKLFPGQWDRATSWIDQQLSALWTLRGPFPGLGSALTAFGIQRGHLLAYALGQHLEETDDPWELVDRAFADPKSLKVDGHIGPSNAKKWANLPEERRALLQLIARFDLLPDQATRFYQPTERKKYGIDLDDEQILRNPYVLYEKDRYSASPITVAVVDRGVFPDASIREHFSIEPPSRVDEAIDSRRVRALMVSILEGASTVGDTLRAQDSIISDVRDLAIQPACPVDEDLLATMEDELREEIAHVDIADGSPAFQLHRLNEMGDLIRTSIEKRSKGQRHQIDADWAALLDKALPPFDPGDKAERLARTEKAAALAELASSRVSVLIGSAGTGKTTLLKVLCNHPAIKAGGVRLLAPTGKARVQIERRTGLHGAQTVAQFLLGEDRYVPKTDWYRLSGKDPAAGPKTVIVDEASMLTEEQLAAVLASLRGVERLVLVGDPRQLPPIGSGRPFVDITTRLAPEGAGTTFPRIAPCYAELTVPRRHVAQEGGGRRDMEDLLLAAWFSGTDPGAGSDEVWHLIEKGEVSDSLRFVGWNGPAELHDLLLDVLAEELPLKNRDDIDGFEKSIGG
jgi:hypothetical protein